LLEGLRAAKLGELPKIISLVSEIFLVPVGLSPIIDELFPLLLNTNNLENLRVMVKDGQSISYVGIWEGKLLIYGLWFNVGMIGAICTQGVSNYYFSSLFIFSDVAT